MKIAILTIGDELLNGDLADTNTPAICRTLAMHSLQVSETVSILDRDEDIINTLQRLSLGFDAVISTGGLGPTEDDRTARATAKAFNRTLSLDDLALQQIKDRFSRMRREMHPANEKQAMLPSGSTVIMNRNGTAPGFSLQQDRAELFFLPGVPSEMLAMLEETVLPAIVSKAGETPKQVRRDISIFGLPEPEVESRLAQGGLPPEISIAFNVELPIVVIKLSATGEDAHRSIDRAELEARKIFRDHIYGTDGETLPGAAAGSLSSAGLSVSLAESCTGGLIAKLLTDQPGASAFLDRSIVSYANAAKTDCLNVTEELLEKHGAVSAECAAAMALGARTTSGTDLALAVTGIAGPEGGTEEKPTGTVFISMTGPNIDRTEKLFFSGSRDQVRLRTAYTALDWLRRYAIDSLQPRQEG